MNAKYAKQKEETDLLKHILANFQNEQSIIENKIKADLSKNSRTDVSYDFYFVTNPEVFVKKEPTGNFFTKFMKNTYNQVTNNKSVP